MTVSAVVPRTRYVGAGTAGPFGFGWRVDNKNQIKVVKVNIATGVETLLTVDVNYTVSGIGVALGGTVTLVAAVLGNGTESLVIVANIPLEQGLTLSDHDDFPAATVEQRLDWMMRIAQRHSDQINRSLVLYETDIWGSGEFNAGANRIANLADPVNAQDAITKYYHDSTFLPVMVGYVADAQAAADDAADSASTAAATMAAADAAVVIAEAAAALAASLAPNVGTSFTKLRSDPYLTLMNLDLTGQVTPDKMWLSGRMLAYGVSDVDPATGLRAANIIQVSDIVDNSSAPGVFSAFTVLHRLGGGATAGTKHTIEANLGISGMVAGDDATGYKALVAMQASAYATANVGGVGGAVAADWSGGLFGGNDHPRLAAGATFWGGVTGREINVEIETGASAWTKVGLWIVKGSNDAVRGYALDVALAIVDNAINGTPWKNGILFGGTSGVWPFSSVDSTLIGAQRRIYPADIGVRTMAAQYGIDFRDVVFTDAAFASHNFKVDDAGEVEARRFQVVHQTVTGASYPIFEGSQEWNDAAVNFLGFFMNVTATASGAGSLIWAIQLNGINQFIMNKFGEVRALVNFGVGIGAATAILWPDANHHLGLHNAANSQKFSVYDTYGSAVNHRRLSMLGGAGYMGIEVEAAGAGIANTDLWLKPYGTGLVRFGTRVANADAAITGYISVKDETGATYKLALIA